MRSPIASVASAQCRVLLAEDLATTRFEFSLALLSGRRRPGAATFHLDIPMAPAETLLQLGATDHYGNAPSIEKGVCALGPGTRLHFPDLAVLDGQHETRLQISYELPRNSAAFLFGNLGVEHIVLSHAFPTARVELAVGLPDGVELVRMIPLTTAATQPGLVLNERDLKPGALSIYTCHFRRRRDLAKALKHLVKGVVLHELAMSVARWMYGQWIG